MFGDEFTPEYIESLVQETNAMYGGKNIDVDNVVFVHGSIDPWHAMGQLTDVNENSPAFVIDGKYISFDTYSTCKITYWRSHDFEFKFEPLVCLDFQNKVKYLRYMKYSLKSNFVNQRYFDTF